MHLGSFGAALREINPDADADTFDYFGETFTVHGFLPPILMMQLGAAVTGASTEAEGMAAMWEAMRCALTKPARAGEDGTETPEDDEQFQRFRHLAVVNRDQLDSLMRLTYAVYGQQAGRPTGQRSSSSAGPLPASTSSRSSSSAHPALAHLRPVSEVLAG